MNKTLALDELNREILWNLKMMKIVGSNQKCYPFKPIF